MKLNKEFFERDTITVAKELLCKNLVRRIGNEELIGKIVETEAYVGGDDLACHASRGRTKRTEIMYGESGHAYVYLVYGIHHLLNIVTEKANFPAAVLIRAVEPILSRQGSVASSQELIRLGSGPGKFTKWMQIDMSLKGEDITKSDKLFISNSLNEDEIEIIETKRIGVDYAEHCSLHPWRFYIKDNPFVSKK